MAIIEQIGVERFLRQSDWFRSFSKTVHHAVDEAFEDAGPTGIQVRSFLNGTWMGRPLHAAVSDVPIGIWTGAVIFDLLSLVTRDRRFAFAADWCVGLGIGAGAITALAGLADYSEIQAPQREEATLHALINSSATTSFIASLVQRLRGNQSAGITLGLVGYGLITIGADLGGHLVYNLGTLVSRQVWKNPPKEFTAILPSAELTDDTLHRADAHGYKVLLARVNGQIYAIGDVCTHWGCSLASGELVGNAVKCPCHGSEFSLRDGSAVRGPASEPEPVFEVRERNGQIEVRLAPSSVPV